MGQDQRACGVSLAASVVLVCGALMLGCGGVDADPRGQVVDSAPGAAVDSAPGIDAALADVPAVCTDFTRVVTAPDGSSVSTTLRYAGVDVGDPHGLPHFSILMCGVLPRPTSPTCPAGHTCTGSAAPVGDCFMQRDVGAFETNGKLMVYCGSKYETKSAAGVVTVVADNGYQTVLVRRE